MLVISLLDNFVRSILQLFYQTSDQTPSQATSTDAPSPSLARLHCRQALFALLPTKAIGGAGASRATLLLVLFYTATRTLSKALGALTFGSLLPSISSSSSLLASPKSRVTAVTRVALLLLALYTGLVYVHLACQLVPFAKVLFGWLSAGAFLYLLVSGFVYFTNKLSYASNVDVIQRFWKRTFSIFWMIEAGLFTFFVYMVLNASAEVWAGYDTPSLFKTQFFSLKMLFVRLSLLSLTILFTSLLVNTVARQDSYGALPLQFFITCLIVVSLWIESYQFYLFVICAPAYAWAFNAEVHETFIEADVRRNRLIRNFVFVCAMAKFWHFLFIAVNWFFYMNRQLEHPDVRSGLLNASIQNLLILYILNLIAMFPYVKHFVHRGLAKPYFWFLVDEGTSALPQAWSFVYTLYTNLV